MRWFCVLLVSLYFSSPVAAQYSAGGTPFSFSADFQERYGHQALKAEKTPKINLKRLLEEDEKRGGTPRFSAPLQVSYSLQNAGQWQELEDGSLLWRLKIVSEGAIALAALYENFYLPPGAKLFMYDEGRQQVLGAYTFVNNPASGRFLTGFIHGQSAIIEYYEPAAVRGQGRFEIFRLDHVYQSDNFRAAQQIREPASLLNFGFGASFPCHKNADCPEGSPWEKQKRSTCLIFMVMEEGTIGCSGTLVNNTAEDGTPYVLSAHHCYVGFTPMYDLWRFDFAYRSSGCANPAQEPVPNSMLGCVFRASRQQSDFLLVEMTGPIPTDYDLYFCGWNRQANTVPASGAILHHPRADIMKLGLHTQPAVIHPSSLNWGGGNITPANHHFRVVYSEGTFELVSSGSGLFDQAGRLRGQLHGGIPNEDCTAGATGYFGRLAMSWAEGSNPESRLSDWLDPLGLGLDTLGGVEQPFTNLATISGTIINESGQPIADVKIKLLGLVEDSTFTATDGSYTFEGVPVGFPAAFDLSKGGSAQNGVSTFDLVVLSKHILGVDLLGSPYKLVAADVNGSNSITTLDQIGIRKIILGIDTAFSGRPNWLFFPENFSFTNPANPFLDPLSNSWLLLNVSGDIADLDFIGIKTGDMDDSADTGGN